MKNLKRFGEDTTLIWIFASDKVEIYVSATKCDLC